MSFFMLDLETLGTAPGCVILSVGIIEFNPRAETPDGIFSDAGKYVVVNKQDCLDNFLHVDPNTVAWWSKQSEEAQQVLHDAENISKALPLRAAMVDVIDYVSEHCSPSTARVLGNGADFDNPILNVAAHMVGVKLPWSYGGRCYRTLKNLHEFLGPQFAAPKVTRSGTYHNALDDAKTQAMHLWETLHNIRALRADK